MTLPPYLAAFRDRIDKLRLLVNPSEEEFQALVVDEMQRLLALAEAGNWMRESYCRADMEEAQAAWDAAVRQATEGTAPK